MNYYYLTTFEKELITNFNDKTNIFNIKHVSYCDEAIEIENKLKLAIIKQREAEEEVDKIRRLFADNDQKKMINKENYELEQRIMLNERLSMLSKESCIDEYNQFIKKYQVLYDKFVHFRDHDNPIYMFNNHYDSAEKEGFLLTHRTWVIYYEIYKKYI